MKPGPKRKPKYKRGANKNRGNDGLCVDCRQSLDTSSDSRCSTCLDKQMEYARRIRGYQGKRTRPCLKPR